MSVRDRIEDSKLLFNAGRLEGALISALIAVAATSRKRYPDRSSIGDRRAFERFLEDERPTLSGGKEVRIELNGEHHTLENILYRFIRSYLVHEGELEEHVSFEYGDFLFDKRGTTDYFTFSSELVLRLAYIVEMAPENKGVFPEGLYDRLPEPIDLKRIAIVKFQLGDDHFEAYCWAASIRSEVWENTGERMNWLHLKGRQAHGGELTDAPGVTLIVPAQYITSVEPGPAYQRTKRRTKADVGVIPPGKPAPQNALELSDIERAIADLQIPLVRTTISVYRPHYESTSSGPPTASSDGLVKSE
jgi:hypothetical protein